MSKHQGNIVRNTLAAVCFCLTASQIQAANLVDIYQLAAQEDPKIVAAEAGMLAELENTKQSRASLLPNISLSASTQTTDRTFGGSDTQEDTNERYNSNGFSATLRQPIIRADRWFQMLSAKASGERAKTVFQDAKQDLLVRVSEAYFNVLRAQDTLDAAVSQEEAFQRQLEQTQERFNVGLIAITEVHEAQAAYDQSRVNRIASEEARDNNFAVLETLTNQRFDEIDGLNKDIPIERPSPVSLQDWVDLALDSNLSLQASKHQVEAARQTIKQRKSGHLPTLDAVVQYNENSSGGRSFLGSESEDESYALQLNIPLFSGGGVRSSVRQANYLLNQAKANYEDTYRTIRQNIQTRHRSVSSDVLRVGAQKLALRSAQSRLEAVEGGYEVGTRNIVDVLQARNDLFNSQSAYYNAIYDYIINTLQLKRTAGTLSDEDLVDLNRWLTGPAAEAGI